MRSIFPLNVCALAIVMLAVPISQICAAASQAGPDGQTVHCERLKELILPDVSIRVAQEVAAGEAGAAPDIAAHTNIKMIAPFLPRLAKAPAFCRVAGSIRPTPESDIRFEVWMPPSGWNGKFQGIGEGGFAGFIDYRGLAIALSRGYASASTDTGHNINDDQSATDWAFKQPEKIKDFSYRGVHLMTVAAKAIIKAFYGAPAHHAYFAGCSGGGRQALMESQRFPEDYDGILAGSPAMPVPDIARNVWLAQIMTRDPAAALSLAKLPALHRAAIKACDRLDGLKDGIIGDPSHCHFDPAVLLCKGAETDQCLTQPQIETARKFYAGLKVPDGKSLHNNLLPGTELMWAVNLAPTPAQSIMAAIGEGWYRDFVYDDRSWTRDQFNLDRELKTDFEIFDPEITPSDPDLSRFRARGGKLIIYHGLTDGAVPVDETIDYVRHVEAKMSPSVARSTVMLFLPPGMNHCWGGDGPSEFNNGNAATSPSDPSHDMSAALERWVETGTPPQKIIASQYAPETDMDGPGPNSKLIRTRPLCPFPQVARWTGKGSSDDAANFTCGSPPHAKST